MFEKKKEDVAYFGRTNFRNQDRLFGIKRKDRRQHMYVIGKTGTGKSTFLHNLIVQDITNGEGLCVIDPHGELVESVLNKVPRVRKEDVIYFNPSDTDFHIGFNVLELPDFKYKHLVASGLMSIFTKIWSNVWSARMEYILNNAVLALLDTPRSSLLGINRILVDKEYRQQIVDNVKDPVVKAFWLHEYEEWKDQFRNEAIAPIQNKVGQFLSTALIRNIVGQEKSTIDIFKIMNEGKIFLVNLSKGKIGEDNSALLGAMIITKVQLSAMERVRIPEEERIDFYLYVDEFQNFATDSFASILSEARKYRLDLLIAHQYVGQLVTDVSTKVRDAVFGNVGTMIVFRVGATDAEFLEQEFAPEITPEDLVNLPNYQAYLKLMVDGVTSRPFSATTLAPFKAPNETLTGEEIIEHSRRIYARPRRIVEEEISGWAGAGASRKVEATCYACGKTTKLNFEPIEGKAIYCHECLEKIKTGKLRPVLDDKDFKARPKPKYFADMRSLGIEIEEEGRMAAEDRREERRYPGGDFRGPRKPRHRTQQEGQPRPFERPPARPQQPRPPRDERHPAPRFTRPRTSEWAPFENGRAPSQAPATRPPQSVMKTIEEKYAPAPTKGETREELSLASLQPPKEKSVKTPKKEKSADVESLRAALRKALTKEIPNP